MKIIKRIKFITSREDFIAMVSALLVKSADKLNNWEESSHNQIIVTGTYKNVMRNEIVYIKTDDNDKSLEDIVEKLYGS